MKISLVDDQFADLHQSEAFLKNYLAQNFSEVADSIQLDTFLNPQDFLNAFEPHKFDLIILDIFMKPLNGIQVAQIIRKRDKDASIIFLTSSEDFILEGYKVFAVGYFLKPFADNADQFNETFSFVFQKLLANQKNLTVTIKNSGLEVSIPYKSIKFIDIDWQHRICIHLAEEKLYPSVSYEKIWSELQNDGRFIECYHRIIVNMDFIKYMEGEDFILNDKTLIPISQRKSRDSKSKYMRHLLNSCL